jgi:hypothetical protein
MQAGCAITVDDDRPISTHEAAIVSWLLRYGVPAGRLLHLAASVPRLRVVSRCGCGCASVDFEQEGQPTTSHPIADALAETPDGSVGLILWGRDDAITGLEIYELSSANIKTLPAIDDLLPWPTA